MARPVGTIELPPLFISALILFGMTVTYLVAYHPAAPYMNGFHTLGLFIFNSQAGLIMLWQAAVGIHILEAFYCLYKLVGKGKVTSPLSILYYLFMTIIFGYPMIAIVKSQLPAAKAENTQKSK